MHYRCIYTIPLVKWARALEVVWDKSSCLCLAEDGRLEALKWLEETWNFTAKEPEDIRISMYAAFGGLEVAVKRRWSNG